MIIQMFGMKPRLNKLPKDRKLKQLSKEGANPLLQQVRKILTEGDKTLILMVKG